MSKVVGFEDRPPQVLTALSISGSAAQSKINAYPADCDFFERIHITRRYARRKPAPSSPTSCARRRWPRPSARPTGSGRSSSGPTRSRRRRAAARSAPDPDVVDARGGRGRPDGGHRCPTVRSASTPGSEASPDPGWCKLDWVIADQTRGQLANASNVLDPTWEAPDGTIVPLDGFLDPYFQEVYLEAESIPLFASWSRSSRRTRSTTTSTRSSTRSGSTPSRSRTSARPRGGCTTSSG